jgi:general secretion pathway protein G
MRKLAIGAIAVLGVGGIAALALIKVRSETNCTTIEWKVKSDLRTIVAAAEYFRLETGRYPERIEEMMPAGASKAGATATVENDLDPWGRPYLYGLVSGKPCAVCLGRDGVPGGTGADADLMSISDEGATRR